MINSDDIYAITGEINTRGTMTASLQLALLLAL